MPQPLDNIALDQMFRAARTVNAYQHRPVPEAVLEQLWDLAKWGPTSLNSLPARIVWCVSQDAKDRLAATAMAGNVEKIQAAPVTAIIGMDMDFVDDLPELFPAMDVRFLFDGNPAFQEATAFRNSSLQGAYLMMAARALGLDCGPMSGFDNAAVDAAFFAGTSVRSNFICTIGYGDPTSPHPRGPRPAFDRYNKIV